LECLDTDEICSVWQKESDTSHSLGDFKQVTAIQEPCLKIAKEEGNKVEERRDHSNFGNTYHNLGHLKKCRGLS